MRFRKCAGKPYFAFKSECMPAMICMLRGVNVGSKNKLEMAAFRGLLNALKVTQVSTYIQSGNAVFYSDKDESALEQSIARALKSKMKIEVPVMVRSLSEWKQVAAGNSFLKRKNIDPARLHVTFLDAAPPDLLVQKIGDQDYLPDEFRLVGRNIYLHCPLGYGISRLSNQFFEKKWGVVATTRNWNTVQQLLQLAEAL